MRTFAIFFFLERLTSNDFAVEGQASFGNNGSRGRHGDSVWFKQMRGIAEEKLLFKDLIQKLPVNRSDKKATTVILRNPSRAPRDGGLLDLLDSRLWIRKSPDFLGSNGPSWAKAAG